ncbi:CPBP family intramembrane glutamic endopeptidase [Clostridium sp. 'White wine YQ']|uniref:CPBP family intramembrane glutamic endopeptidase n=1 Tax=Clostridium sp. 'White wine YQ' TaxID=3027474 RepID=UPI002366092D|nr:type II CAAX endopeptidase family protein [Clostridium sp. 'White wine YQ']MDD7796017.1 type II CAAX endopeptidase family protein [Clostridium sp. 'White wine YQ']
MEYLFSNENSIFKQVQKQKTLPIILVLLIPIFIEVISEFLSIVIAHKFILGKFILADINPIYLLISRVIVIGLYIILVLFIEKRKIQEIGFKINKGFFNRYLFGILIGLLMMSVITVIIVMSGNAQIYKGKLSSKLIPSFIILIFAWLIQGASEEVMMRGYMMPVIGKKYNVLIAIIITSCYFAFLHLANNGIDRLSIINLILFGIFAAFYTIYTEDIWGICAIHSAWNMAQGNLYGFLVSGNPIMVGSIFNTLSNTKNIINGAAFGPEGGLVVTIVLIISILIVTFLAKKKHKTI